MSSLKNKKINKIADVTISSSNIDNKKFDIYITWFYGSSNTILIHHSIHICPKRKIFGC